MRSLAAGFKTRSWQTGREYRHMLWNNVVLLSMWMSMCWAAGAGRFFAIYLISVSLAGGAGIVLFAVQHNFEHAYASNTRNWNRDPVTITSIISRPKFRTIASWNVMPNTKRSLRT